MSKYEVPIGDKSLFSFYFANDQVILVEDKVDMELMLRKQHKKWGLH